MFLKMISITIIYKYLKDKIDHYIHNNIKLHIFSNLFGGTCPQAQPPWYISACAVVILFIYMQLYQDRYHNAPIVTSFRKF